MAKERFWNVFLAAVQRQDKQDTTHFYMFKHTTSNVCLKRERQSPQRETEGKQTERERGGEMTDGGRDEDTMSEPATEIER